MHRRPMQIESEVCAEQIKTDLRSFGCIIVSVGGTGGADRKYGR